MLNMVRVPVSMLALASMLFVPALFASAAEKPHHAPAVPFQVEKPLHPRFHLGEVVKVDTTTDTIIVKSLKPSDENNGSEYLLVTYNQETVFSQDSEETDESALSVGDKVHVRGDVNLDSQEYFAEVDANVILLFDETLPPRPARPPVQSQV